MRKLTGNSRLYVALFLVIAVFGWVFEWPTPAQSQQAPARALVIEGGTLIDGNGGAPLADSEVVILGNKISSVSRKGQVPYPANATIIKAEGKYVLPGLFDSQNSYSWYLGEGMLNYGITSVVDVGTTGETAVPYRDAVMHGMVRGPRGFTGLSRISANPNALVNTGYENILTHTRVPKSPDDVRQMVRTWVANGSDYILFYDGALPSLDFYKAGFEEAAKTNTPVYPRPYGPVFFPKDAALMGATALPHSAGIGIAVTKDPSKFKQGRDDRNELDRYAEMDETKARETVKVLVDHHVMLVPTFMINFPGYPKEWDRFTQEARAFFNNPELLAYYPPTSVQTALRSYTRIDQGEVRARRLKGYENVLRFHKMFLDAGGKIVVSGNTNDAWVPGVDMHQEMEIMADVGLTPMQIIMGSTKYAAEMLHKQDIIGTIDKGKLADVIIIDADPLQDIKNMRKINTVIQDGKIVELGYHANFTSPFNNSAAKTVSMEGLPWAEAMKKATSCAEGAPQRVAEDAPAPDPAFSPQPAIETMNPIIVTQGAATTVKLTGFNFVRKSTVYFKGRLVPSKVVAAGQMEVTLDADALREAGRFNVVVKNPDPLDDFFVRSNWGNGTSNIAHLIVNYKY